MQLTGNSIDELLVERNCQLWRSRAIERRPRAFFQISIQCELTDDEDPAVYVGHTTVHLALIVVKHAQLTDLAGKPSHIPGSVTLPDAEKDQQALLYGSSNFPVHGHTGPQHPLNNRSHAKRKIRTQYADKTYSLREHI